MISLQKHNGKQYLMFGEAFIGNNVVNVYMEYGMEYGVWKMFARHLFADQRSAHTLPE
jgi:hypothetical protein